MPRLSMLSTITLILMVIVVPGRALAAVTEVILSPGQATVTRTESQSIEAGTGQITIAELPAGLIDSSLRVSLPDAKDITLGQTSVRVEQRTEPVTRRIRNLQDQLTAVGDEIQAMNDDIRASQYRLSLLDQITKQPGDTLSTDDISATADTLYQQASDALRAVRQVEKEKRELVKEQNRIKRELALVQQGAKAVKNLQIGYNSPSATDLTVKVTYQIRQAGWTSHYDARLNTQDNQLTLNHVAVIQQSTGEDWRDVELWLSTSNADAGGTLPQPSPWYVTPRPQARSSQADSFAGQELATMSKSQEPAPQPTRLEQTGLTQRYRIPGTVSVEDGERQQRLQVTSHQLDAEVAIHMVPALSPQGFIHATAEYNGDATLPTAQVTLYQDNQFTGSNRLEQVQPGEPLELAFGVDDRIAIEVIPDTDQQGEKGLISGEKYIERINRYKITNNHQSEAKVRVIDRLPVSRQDDITITYQSISKPVQENVDDQKGIIAWDRSIAPGETLSLTSGFELRVPDDQELPWLQQ